MDNFARFKNRNAKYSDAQSAVNAHFILNGYPSTTITSGNSSVPAAVVNQQEKNKAYIYTKTLNPLTVGSVWATKGLHFLILECLTHTFLPLYFTPTNPGLRARIALE